MLQSFRFWTCYETSCGDSYGCKVSKLGRGQTFRGPLGAAPGENKMAAIRLRWYAFSTLKTNNFIQLIEQKKLDISQLANMLNFNKGSCFLMELSPFIKILWQKNITKMQITFKVIIFQYPSNNEKHGMK